MSLSTAEWYSAGYDLLILIKQLFEQVSIRELRARGLQADILFCRCNSELSPHVIEKLGLFCQVPTDRVGSEI